ncbi:MAG: protein kinase [Rudaea sp.]|uniref:protein kinase domain-containing protein n=1 Tax=unclassified Rudaea TaxID=2627037 RepID=UPI0010F9FC69|nr:MULTISPECIES: protein kinase [unclassified Rudaea]MBN8888120.1 protein kinase [Rudaea sp.]
MSELRRLFELVCDLPAPQREAALQAAGADAALAADVLALLDADAATRTRSRAPLSAMIRQFSATELQPGDVLDAWRLVREIGHGGMGAVYLAERADGHFTQQAAIKLIRGAAHGDVAARFARERQLLANLQHPQIARLLDGGATPGGAPYLVMEYVDGVALDAWCERTKASLEARLRVFVSICATLQFAHQHLVVHCDLKPSNVLVRDDDTPVLLDFGIARALDRIEATADEHSYLTPSYASPEQARAEAPTVASDVYALGLLLYRLATDATPPAYDPANPQPMPAPSAATANVPWRSRLRGDIDAICARACALDPARRYPSALALAEDIERIAAHRPVLARKPTLAYVGARLLRRCWPAFTVGALMLAVAIGFTWRTLHAERDARAQAATAESALDFVGSVFALSNPKTSGRHDFSAREVLDQGALRIERDLAAQPRVRARLLETLGEAYRGINEGTAGAPLLEKAAALNLDPSVADPLAAARAFDALSRALLDTRQSAERAEEAAHRALQLVQEHAADDSERVAAALDTYAAALIGNDKHGEARKVAEQSLQLRERSGAAPLLVARSLHNLSQAALHQADFPQAHKLCAREIDLYRSAGATHTDDYRAALVCDSIALHRSGEQARATETSKEALALAIELYGEDSATATSSRLSLVQFLTDAGQYADALTLVDQAVAARARLDGERSGRYAMALSFTGWVRHEMGSYTEALPRLQRAAAIYEKYVAKSPNDTTLQTLRVYLAANLVDMGQTSAETRKLLDNAIAAWTASDPKTIQLAYTRLPLAKWHVANKEYAEAALLLDQLDAPEAKTNYWIRSRAAQLRADIARVKGDAAAALRFDELAYTTTLGEVGATHPHTARYGLLWARSLRASGQEDKADALEKPLRPIFEAAFPADSAFRRE